jgi:hypothetical protein
VQRAEQGLPADVLEHQHQAVVQLEQAEGALDRRIIERPQDLVLALKERHLRCGGVLLAVDLQDDGKAIGKPLGTPHE